MEKEINLLQFNELIDKNNSAFLCGNGFSINFDSDFGNVFNRLYDSHKEVIYNSKYEIKSNKLFTQKCKENYLNVIEYLHHISESKFYKIFDDAVIFAESIRNNKKLIEELWEKKKLNMLVFGFSQVDILTSICDVGRTEGTRYVNIEHWTILVYFYFRIKEINPEYYNFPKNNSFISVVKRGGKSKIILMKDIHEDVIFNGFTIYLRMLFSTAIFANGKALDFSKLNRLCNLELPRIKLFLEKFKALISLNYDHIIENIVDQKVEHLHGQYKKEIIEYVYNQSFSLRYYDGYVSFSDILIGDYFVFKSFLPVVNNHSRNSVNKKVPHFSDKLDSLIRDNKINTIVLFGLNIDNDYHVLRNIMLGLFSANVVNPRIIYCYYRSTERIQFEKQHTAVITFSKEASTYAENIELCFIKTQDILKDYFEKKKN